jgi:hypothetical protein
MTRRSRSGTWVAFALAVLASLTVASAAAFAGGSDPSASPAAEPSEPAASEDAALDLCWDEALGFEQPPCELGAGRYQPSRLMPPAAFDLGEGWLNFRYYEDGIDLVRDGEPVDLSMIVGADEGLVDATPDDPADEPTTVEIGPGAQQMANYLSGHPALEVVSDVEEVTVGGLPAKQLDVRVPSMARGILLLNQDAYNLFPGDAARVWIIEHPTATITLILEVFAREGAESASPEDVGTYLDLVEPIVSSLTFPGAEVSPAPSL